MTGPPITLAVTPAASGFTIAAVVLAVARKLSTPPGVGVVYTCPPIFTNGAANDAPGPPAEVVVVVVVPPVVPVLVCGAAAPATATNAAALLNAGRPPSPIVTGEPLA